MRILVIGDFHGKFSLKLEKALKKEAKDVDLIVGLGDYTGIDDWRPYINYAFKSFAETGTYIGVEEFYGKRGFKKLLRDDENAGKKVLSKLTKLGKPVIGVFGNGDDNWYKYPFSNIWEVHKSKRRFVNSLKNFKEITYGKTKFNGVNFAGFGGYMDVKANYSRKEGKSLRNALRRLGKSRKKLLDLAKGLGNDGILVLHYTPKGAFDIILDKKSPFHGKSTGIEIFREAILKFKPKIAFCGHMHEYQGEKKIGKTLVINPGEAARGRFAVVDLCNLKTRFIK